ncbi:MAG: hypothetical protein GF375_03940 [Candidatus Omnitrophica bacterium]|nr:hypothetical protein [Candidatus Omnitrophota bacterium]MBD3269208.1 hypothetical protein [Candidatus Omnitrophota bacterium]
MEQKKRRYFGTRLPKKYKFVEFVIALLILFSFLNAYIAIRMFEEGRAALAENTAIFDLQFIFVLIGLILVATLGYILHYSFGAVSRMEKVLDKFMAGDRSVRINLRKKDIMYVFSQKLNGLLDWAENISKGH